MSAGALVASGSVIFDLPSGTTFQNVPECLARCAANSVKGSTAVGRKHAQ
jgi:hypothetical protein